MKNKIMQISSLFFLFFLLSWNGIAQNTWYVNDNSLTGDTYTTAMGNDGNAGTAAAPFLTIQKAINSAADGDIIKVDAGTYVENNYGWVGLRVIDKSIKIVGSGSASTKVQITNLTNGIEFNNNTLPSMSVWLEGMTFEPYGATGPGFFVRIGETGGTFEGITMKDMIVSKAEARNVVLDNGGTYSNIFVENSKFVDSKYFGFSIINRLVN